MGNTTKKTIMTMIPSGAKGVKTFFMALLAIALSVVAISCGSSGTTDSTTYSVGGTVSGLTDTVVLQNNGGNNLTISANGAFIFTTEIANGSTFAVTVSTQPSGQTCSVTNDSGTISDANVTNVAVTCLDAVGSYKVVDTNQSLCYDSSTGATATCSGTGYDADYSGNQPSYTVSSSGDTVTDNVTELIWTQSTDIDGSEAVDYNDKRFQSEAVTYCDDLTLDSYSDWRLPDIKEAYSLILFSGEDASSYSGTDTSTLTLFIDSSFDRAFGDLTTTEGIDAGDRIIDGQYASTSIYVSTTMNSDATMFGVNYVDGRIKGYPTAIKEFYVRCVRGNTDYGVNDYTDNGDTTISDSATELMWQQDDSSSTNWEDAISTCEDATTATHSDWRLPNAKELQSILDYSRSPDTTSSAAIDSVFNATSFTNEEGETEWGYYWASTTHADNDDTGKNGTYLSFGRALGYFMGNILDVHGAGSQRSNSKVDVSTNMDSLTNSYGTFYYNGPQGDILRLDNYVRCVRDDS